MGTEFYRKVERAGSYTLRDKGIEREQAIRVYRTFVGDEARETSRWLLQVRGPQWVGSGYTEGKAFMIAGATLNRKDLVALRDAIDTLLKETP